MDGTHICFLPLSQTLTPTPSSTPIAIIDDENRIIAILLGRPVAKPGTPDDWPTVVAGLEAAINKLGEEGDFSKEERNHRRGPLPAKDFGISHGGGQTVRITIFSILLDC